MPADAAGAAEAAPGSSRATATGTGKDLTNLDALRAIAVLAVLYSHTMHDIPRFRYTEPYSMGYGAFGVAIFFLHTALVLMWSLERRPDTLDFYIRRAARIYPLAIVVLLFIVAMHIPVGAYAATGPVFVHTHPTWKQVVEHALLVQNLFSGSFILYVMWSLPIEVQMYVVLPVLFFFAHKTKALWPLLVFAALALMFSIHKFGAQDLNMVSAAPYFLSGVIAYVGFMNRRAWIPGWLFVPLVIALVWIGGHSHNWRLAVIPCLFLGLVLPSFRQMGSNLFTKAAWYVARYSYGLYLLHPVCLALGLYYCRNRPWPVQVAVVLASLIIFVGAGYHLVEAPCIRLGARVARSVRGKKTLARA